MKQPYMRNINQYERDDEKISTVSFILILIALALLMWLFVNEIANSIDKQAAIEDAIIRQEMALVRSDLKHKQIVDDYRELKSKYITRAELQSEFIKREGK